MSDHDEFLGELAVATYCYGNIQNLSLIGALAEVRLLTWLLRPRSPIGLSSRMARVAALLIWSTLGK